MSYMKLIKLMYLADRTSLLRWGSPITFDLYYSMSRGPVLSNVKDLITEDPWGSFGKYWGRYISRPIGEYEVQLTGQELELDDLSRADIEIAEEVFETYGHYSRFDLVDFTHTLPEWTRTSGRIPIEYADILRAGGKTPAQVAVVEQSMEEISFADSLLKVDA